MTQKDSIAEKNRIIADFMGWVHSKEPEIDRWEMEGLNYHSDWSWLMPVWYKFRDLRFESDKLTFQFSSHRQFVAHCICYENINAAHQALYDAICWYNTTIKKES